VLLVLLLDVQWCGRRRQLFSERHGGGRQRHRGAAA
jgi:hypothetical protein